MQGRKYMLFASVIVFFILAYVFLTLSRIGSNQKLSTNNPVVLPKTITTDNDQKIQSESNNNKLIYPIDKALSRITKKPFGIRVSPLDSPVSPERFTGYHTGVDFETSDLEKDKDVPIYAICSGNIIMKKVASGYGGVLVQECIIENKNVTVVYGHLNLNSISFKVGQYLEIGKKIAVLGKGFSNETSGERKHLHLGIHIGDSINIAGYTNHESELSNWIDPGNYLFNVYK